MELTSIMTTHHGNPPLDPEATWTKVTAYAAKNKELQAQRNKEKEESIQNEAQEVENEATSTRTNAIESNYTTRINFKVIPDKNTKTLSVLNSINRILESTKAIDPTTCIVANDKNGNEIVYTGQLHLPSNKEEATAYINQFIQEPKMSARNELVGLITLKSNTNFRAIKKRHAVQQGLNEFPKIFLTLNYLSVVTPVLVGFFVNQYPRLDMPETFQDRINDFI
jgi:hypothetical protein